jgi:hypothetical protein
VLKFVQQQHAICLEAAEVLKKYATFAQLFVTNAQLSAACLKISIVKHVPTLADNVQMNAEIWQICSLINKNSMLFNI